MPLAKLHCRKKSAANILGAVNDARKAMEDLVKAMAYAGAKVKVLKGLNKSFADAFHTQDLNKSMEVLNYWVGALGQWQQHISQGNPNVTFQKEGQQPAVPQQPVETRQPAAPQPQPEAPRQPQAPRQQAPAATPRTTDTLPPLPPFK